MVWPFQMKPLQRYFWTRTRFSIFYNTKFVLFFYKHISHPLTVYHSLSSLTPSRISSFQFRSRVENQFTWKIACLKPILRGCTWNIRPRVLNYLSNFSTLNKLMRLLKYHCKLKYNITFHFSLWFSFTDVSVFEFSIQPTLRV